MRIYAKVPFWVIIMIVSLAGLYLFYYQGLSLNDIIDLIVKKVL